MLLVDHDQADVLERREHGRPRADDDVDVAAADALPLIVALAVGEAAVLDGDALAECLPEQERGGRRQRDFRNEHQHAAARCPDLRRQADVDFGLAAAGDAVQQRDVKRARIGEFAEAAERLLLLACQLTVGYRSDRHLIGI